MFLVQQHSTDLTYMIILDVPECTLFQGLCCVTPRSGGGASGKVGVVREDFCRREPKLREIRTNVVVIIDALLGACSILSGTSHNHLSNMDSLCSCLWPGDKATRGLLAGGILWFRYGGKE